MRLGAGTFLAQQPVSQPAASSGAALLRVAEAAEQLAISRTKLYQLISAGQIKVIRIGRTVRFRGAKIARWTRVDG